MRVITGKARGHRLASVPGESTVPTSDRVKNAIFNIIQFGIEGRRVLDLFAGTGQLGIEALSRGAARAVFLDSSPGALAIIRGNLRSTGFVDLADVVPQDIRSFDFSGAGPFDIIFMDPPFRSPLMATALDGIVSADILRPGGILLCECARDGLPPLLSHPYERVRVYYYGKVAVCLYRRIS